MCFRFLIGLSFFHLYIWLRGRIRRSNTFVYGVLGPSIYLRNIFRTYEYVDTNIILLFHANTNKFNLTPYVTSWSSVVTKKLKRKTFSSAFDTWLAFLVKHYGKITIKIIKLKHCIFNILITCDSLDILFQRFFIV